MPRRPKEEAPPATPRRASLVAAAKRLETAPPPGAPSRIKIPREEWQDDAWDYYDAVPEVKHAARYVGNAMAKLRLFPAIEDPDDPEAPPIPITDARAKCPPAVQAAAIAELRRVKSERGGQPEILKQMAINLEVAGEGYIVGIAEHDETEQINGKAVTRKVAETWEFHSVSEIDVKNKAYVILPSPGSGEKLRKLGAEDTCIRVWQRHPRWADKPDCALAGLLIECEALHTLALQIIGESLSKRNNGFLLVPSGLTFGSANVTDSEEDDPDTDPAMEALTETMQGPIADPSAPSSVQPTLVRGDKEELASFRHVLAQRDAGDSIDARIEARVQRLARGIDLPVEVVLGHQSTTFANAGQVDQDTFDDYLAPRADLQMDAFTYGYYTPQLRANVAVGPDWAERIFAWYDPSKLVTQPNPSDNAVKVHERKAISDATLRRTTGFSEDDAPDEAELLRRTAIDRGPIDPAMMVAFIAAIAKIAGVELPDESAAAPATPPAAAASAALEAETLALGRRRGTPNRYGARLLAIDQHLRTRLATAADDAMNRALERAGNRLRSKAPSLGVTKATLRNVASRDVAATIGPSLVGAAATDALDGAWDELETSFRAWVAQAQNDALDAASKIISGMTVAERDSVLVRQAASVDEAWTWLKGSLETLAQARLFDPTPAAPEFGEFDETINIPTGLIRQALQRAGGATGLVTNGRDAWVALYPDGRPAGMIGTGEDIMGVLTDGGAGVEGYEWVYGPAARSRPFDPHVELGDIPAQWVNFDDDVLANSSGWPDDAYYFPGDHSGCLCDFEPIIIAPDEAG